MANSKNDYVWVSLGENCLTQSIIERNKKNTIRSPFSFCVSNIDYGLHLEGTNYQDLLSAHNLYLKNGKYMSKMPKCDPIFWPAGGGDFDLRHFDLKRQSTISGLHRKIRRMIDLRENDCGKIFLYHHRINPNSDITRVSQKIQKFISLYPNSRGVMFYQKIIPEQQQETVSLEILNEVFCFCFNTRTLWSGPNHRLFNALVNNELIDQMINTIDLNAL